MSSEILRGFVINKNNFKDTNEIVKVLTNDEILSFISLGSRKITSKNRNALQLGNLIEIEIFRSRLTNKLSKLKKATTIVVPSILISDTAEVVMEICNLLSGLNNSSKELFETMVNSYNYFGINYNHHVKTFILFNTLSIHGVNPITSRCVECSRTDRIQGFEFYLGGFTCIFHTKNKRSLGELKAFQKLSISIEEYINVDPLLNKKIFLELYSFLKNNFY